MASEGTTPTEAVRLYLTYLEDPSKLIDQTEVRKAQERADNAKDVLERLRALSDREHARQADGRRLEQDFIRHAMAFAQAENIPVKVLREMGVPPDVLFRAGFSIGARRGRGSVQSGVESGRRPRMPIGQVKAAARQLPKRFTLRQLAEQAGGGSQATLRKAIQELISEDHVRRVGPMERYQGRGRAPIVYELR